MEGWRDGVREEVISRLCILGEVPCPYTNMRAEDIYTPPGASLTKERMIERQLVALGIKPPTDLRVQGGMEGEREKKGGKEGGKSGRVKRRTEGGEGEEQMIEKKAEGEM